MGPSAAGSMVSGMPTALAVGTTFTVEATKTGATPRIHSAQVSMIVCGPIPPAIIINEVDIGDPDWLELWNQGATDLDISGFTLGLHDARTTNVTLIYTFPAGAVIPAGGLVEIREDLGTDIPPTIFYTQVRITNWAGTSTGAVSLEDANGASVDFVQWLCVQNSPMPACLSWTCMTQTCAPLICTVDTIMFNGIVLRDTATDTDTPADWTSSAENTGTPGMLNPGQ